MKVLITYACAGTGHRRAAEAIFNYLSLNYKEFDVKIVDVLDYTNSLFKKIYSQGYTFLVSRLPLLWSIAYQVSYSSTLRALNRNINYILSRLNTKKFEQFILNYNPDIIVTTHFLPCEVAAFLKAKRKINSKLICIITDFNVHPLWIIKGVDQYFVAFNLTKEELFKAGIPPQIIKVSGIPIDMKFSRRIDKNSLYNKFGLKKGQFTLLVMTAGFGLGPIEKIVGLLQKDTQMLVVCGNNNRLYRRLLNKGYNSVKIFGFVDNIDELMSVSDLVITKPGGLTISECLAMGLPMIFISAIYGQETKNAKILESYGAGISPPDLIMLKELALSYKNNPDRLNALRERIDKIKTPYAAREISEWFLQKSY